MCCQQVGSLQSGPLLDITSLGMTVKGWIRHPQPPSEAALRPFLQDLANLNEPMQLQQVVYAWAAHRYREARHTDDAKTSDNVAQILQWAAAHKMDLPSWRDPADLGSAYVPFASANCDKSHLLSAYHSSVTHAAFDQSSGVAQGLLLLAYIMQIHGSLFGCCAYCRSCKY